MHPIDVVPEIRNTSPAVESVSNTGTVAAEVVVAKNAAANEKSVEAGNAHTEEPVESVGRSVEELRACLETIKNFI